MVKVSVSILNIKEKSNIKILETHKPDFIHIDVMDGKFVNNTACLYDDIKDYLDDYKYDVHLMVEDVKQYVDQFKNINPEFITFHVETNNIIDNITYIKNLGIKVGLAINPNTDLAFLYPYLDLVDLVLVMSVNPGLGGQEFIDSSVEKIETLYNYRLEHNLNYLISVDGGINNLTIDKVRKCDMAVSGSYILKSSDIDESLNIIRGVK